MSLNSVLQSLQDTGFATAVRENESLFPTVESVHVLAICLVVGTIMIVDLRLLGLASRDQPVLGLSQTVLRLTWIAFAVAVISGGLLFSAKAIAYSGNFFFIGKMALLALAGLNMLAFHFVTGRGLANWGANDTPPLGARISGGLSLLLWVGVIGFGRWIGFTLH